MMDCSSILRNYSRYLLVFFNLIFSLTGIVIISVGVSAKAYFHEFDNFLNDKYVYASDLLIIIGVIIFFIAFFGCCGAIKENACMTTTFSSLLIIIFILEVVAALSGILLKSRTESFLVDTLRETIREYDQNKTEIDVIWDKVQSQYKCCGIWGPSDWLNETITNSTNSSIPMSCCHIPPGTTNTFTCDQKNAYSQGCLQEFGDLIRANMSIIEGVGIGLALIQLLGIILSCYLAKAIRSDYETV